MILHALAERFHLYPPNLGDAPLKEDRLVSTPVAGFKAGAAACGLRKDARVDLAMVAAEEPVPAAGVFTQNKLAAAPVLVCREHIKSGKVRAILANSGGANAATGQPGMEACIKTCQAAAKELGCEPGHILPSSTGVIGQLLNADKVAAGLPALVADLSGEGLSRGRPGHPHHRRLHQDGRSRHRGAR
jgi:glutamate N-acetyltransferase/amino-acid N-acetyltransferase